MCPNLIKESRKKNQVRLLTLETSLNELMTEIQAEPPVVPVQEKKNLLNMNFSKIDDMFKKLKSEDK